MWVRVWWLGRDTHKEERGGGYGGRQGAVSRAEIAGHCGATALMLAAHNALGSSHLLLASNEEQKARYLPKLARGECLGAWALSEPGCGSDAAALTTTAAP